MTVREAMDIINGALDSLYEFYDNDADSMLEEIGAAEAVLEKLVQKEESKPEKCFAECPDCGHELLYYTFECDDYDEEVITFLASGYCPHCQKDFAWKENFELIDIEYDED